MRFRPTFLRRRLHPCSARTFDPIRTGRLTSLRDPGACAVLYRLGQILCLVVALQFSGAQWLAMQIHAWGGMAADRVESGESLGDALRSAVGDQVPCHRCVALKDARESSDGREQELPGAEVEFKTTPMASVASPLRPARPLLEIRSLADELCRSWRGSPELDPPEGRA